MKTTRLTALAILAVTTYSASGVITPVDATRYVASSRMLQVSGAAYQQDFDQYDQWPVFGDMNQTVHVAGSQGSITQESTATQRSTMMNGSKLVYVESFASATPGQWYRGTNAQSQAGSLSEFSFRISVTEAVNAELSANVRGTAHPGTTLNAEINAYRNGQRMFNYNIAPTGGAYGEGTYWMFSMQPGTWEFTANINVTGMGGMSTGADRYADMSMIFDVSANAVPGIGGSVTLAVAGLLAASRRRR